MNGARFIAGGKWHTRRLLERNTTDIVPDENFSVKKNYLAQQKCVLVIFSSSMKSPALPIEEIFHLIPALYPHLVRLVDQAGITPADLFALNALRHFGRVVHGRYMMPVSDFHKMLLKAGAFQTASGASGYMTRLVERALISRQSITAADRAEYFPNAQGWKSVAVLAPAGERALSEIAAALQALFLRAVEEVPSRVVSEAARGIAAMPQLTQALQSMWLNDDTPLSEASAMNPRMHAS